MNIAQDCEINQYIRNLPKTAVTLEKLSEELGKPLKSKAGSWYYYKEIQEFARNNPDKCIQGTYQLKDLSAIDDHNKFNQPNISEAQRILQENQIKNMLKESAEQINKQMGSIPGELTEILNKIKAKPPVFNWKKYMKRLIENSITSDIRLTRMRPSKRIPGSKGVIFKRKPSILVGVDVSGSINTKDLEDFFSEINHIYKAGTKVTVVECDTQIQNIFEYKGNQNIEIKGRGGTILNSIVEYYKQHKEYSACIIFTDGYCDTTMPLCNNLIWVITSNGNKSQNYNPGQVILIP